MSIRTRSHIDSRERWEENPVKTIDGEQVFEPFDLTAEFCGGVRYAA